MEAGSNPSEDLVVDLLIDTFSAHRIEDDEGICLSGSSSPFELDDTFDTADALWIDLIDNLLSNMETPLDLRKNIDASSGAIDLTSKPPASGSTIVARGTPTSTPLPPPLIPISSPTLADSIQTLSHHEKEMLRQSYQRLVHFLRLDSPVVHYLEKDRQVALKRLQAFLLVYLIQVKSKNLTPMFHDSFGNEAGIRQFFRVLLSKSEQLTRRSSLPANLPGRLDAEHPSVATAATAHPQILSRGPVGLRNATHNNAPYPPPSRRTDSVRASPHGSHRGSNQSSYYTGYPHPPPAPIWPYGSNPPSYHQEPLPVSYPHPPDTGDAVPTFREDQHLNVDDAIRLVLRWLPIDKDIQGLSDEDFLQLYGPKQVAPYNDNLTMTPSPSGSSNQPHSGGGGGSIPGSPASPWQLATFVGSSLNSPYTNVMSPPLSNSSSPAPASPLPRSVENQMTRMTLSQPPPLIPLDIKDSTNPKRITFRSAHDEMLAELNPIDKEQSMRQVVKCTLETLTKADQDGDTLLMIACANSNYKNEDIYALIERLKSHPQPTKVFSAMNNRRESAIYLAAIERRALVSGYLAETMSSLNIPLNQTYEKGNTIIHYLAIWGDEFNDVLRYLVRIRTADNKPAFDLNARNHTGRSALHESVMLYIPNDSVGEGYIKNIQLLLEHGADAGLSDITSGKTPVHIAVEKRDPFLLELLLSKCPGSANAPMYNDNRPLHSAATLTDVTDVQQLELVNILLKYGADKALRNKANKLPIELVQQDRDQVKAVLQARSRQNH